MLVHVYLVSGVREHSRKFPFLMSGNFFNGGGCVAKCATKAFGCHRPELDASMLLRTSPTSRSSSSPHQPGKSPSSAMGPLLLATRMTRGVARGRHGTMLNSIGVP